MVRPFLIPITSDLLDQLGAVSRQEPMYGILLILHSAHSPLLAAQTYKLPGISVIKVPKSGIHTAIGKSTSLSSITMIAELLNLLRAADRKGSMNAELSNRHIKVWPVT